jgi:FHA domain
VAYLPDEQTKAWYTTARNSHLSSHLLRSNYIMEATLTSPQGRTDLTSNVLTLGRAPDNQLALQDQQASSHHAEIRPDQQGYLLIDTNSRNGTFVNEQRLAPQTPRLLISGDVIRIGETRFTYEIAGSDDATVRANVADYANPGYSPTVAVPPPSSQPNYSPASQPGYMNYQQPAPAAPNFQQAQPPNYPQQPQAFPPPAYPQQPQGYQQQPQGYPQQAPWAGAPGQFGAPGAAVATRPKKRRSGLMIGLIVLLLVVVGGGSLYFFALRSTPEKTLQAYCTALQNSDAQGAFNQLSASAQSKTSVAQFNSGFQALKNPLIGGIKSCTFNNVQQNGSTATADVTLTVGNPAVPAKPTAVTLIDENGTWKLNSNSQATP